MSAIDQFAEDVNGVVADLESQFKVLGDRKRKLQDRGNDIALRWAKHFEAQDRALTQAEQALNRISNVPVTKTEQTDSKVTALSAIPKVSP